MDAKSSQARDTGLVSKPKKPSVFPVIDSYGESNPSAEQGYEMLVITCRTRLRIQHKGEWFFQKFYQMAEIKVKTRAPKQEVINIFHKTVHDLYNRILHDIYASQLLGNYDHILNLTDQNGNKMFVKDDDQRDEVEIVKELFQGDGLLKRKGIE